MTAPDLLLLLFFTEEILTKGRLLRFFAKSIAQTFVVAEVGAIRLVQFLIKPQYLLLGKCHRCGVCCENIVGDPPSWFKKTKLMNLYISYHRYSHHFEPVATGPNDEVIFRCGHLQTDGSCGIYRFRPLICRTYPLQSHYDAPNLLPECSYQVAHRTVANRKPPASLPILNPHVAVHHPTPLPIEQGTQAAFELVDWSTPIEHAIVEDE